MKTTTIGVSLAALAAIFIGAAQAAAEPRETRVVRYADPNLATDAGKDALEHRIDSAVGYVCHGDRGERRLTMRRAQRECARATRADSQTSLVTAVLRANRFASLSVKPILAQEIEANLLSPRGLERAQDLNGGEADIQTMLTENRTSGAQGVLLTG